MGSRSGPGEQERQFGAAILKTHKQLTCLLCFWHIYCDFAMELLSFSLWEDAYHFALMFPVQNMTFMPPFFRGYQQMNVTMAKGVVYPGHHQTWLTYMEPWHIWLELNPQAEHHFNRYCSYKYIAKFSSLVLEKYLLITRSYISL